MKTFSIRLEDDVYEELEFLRNVIFSRSKSSVIEGLIRQEYHKHKSDPRMKKAIESIEQIKSIVEGMKNE